MAIEFRSWGKTPRLFRDIVVTEKVDGTNSAVIIEKVEPDEENDPNALAVISIDGDSYQVAAQSRTRLIYPGKTTDNYGFAAFVQYNAQVLVELLGEGHHFGEYWGSGIQGRYEFPSSLGLRGFALFNTAKWRNLKHWLSAPDGRQVLLESVPVLYEGPFEEQAISKVLHELERDGSWISPSDRAEGVVIYHTQSKQVYKVTLDNNDKGKWEIAGGVTVVE